MCVCVWSLLPGAITFKSYLLSLKLVLTPYGYSKTSPRTSRYSIIRICWSFVNNESIYGRLKMLVLLFVALWFILRGDLLYVFPCVILFLCFSVLLVLRLPLLGKRELILVLFVRLFGLCLFRFLGFLFLLGSGKGCGL